MICLKNGCMRENKGLAGWKTNTSLILSERKRKMDQNIEQSKICLAKLLDSLHMPGMGLFAYPCCPQALTGNNLWRRVLEKL
jgi:hypothetical protein